MTQAIDFDPFNQINPNTGNFLLDHKPKYQSPYLSDPARWTLQQDPSTKDGKLKNNLRSGINFPHTFDGENGQIVKRQDPLYSGDGFFLDFKIIQPKYAPFVFEESYNIPVVPSYNLVSNFIMDAMNNCYYDGTPKNRPGTEGDKYMAELERQKLFSKYERTKQELNSLIASGFDQKTPEYMQLNRELMSLQMKVNPNFALEEQIKLLNQGLSRSTGINLGGGDGNGGDGNLYLELEDGVDYILGQYEDEEEEDALSNLDTRNVIALVDSFMDYVNTTNNDLDIASVLDEGDFENFDALMESISAYLNVIKEDKTMTKGDLSSLRERMKEIEDLIDLARPKSEVESESTPSIKSPPRPRPRPRRRRPNKEPEEVPQLQEAPPEPKPETIRRPRPRRRRGPTQETVKETAKETAKEIPDLLEELEPLVSIASKYPGKKDFLDENDTKSVVTIINDINEKIVSTAEQMNIEILLTETDQFPKFMEIIDEIAQRLISLRNGDDIRRVDLEKMIQMIQTSADIVTIATVRLMEMINPKDKTKVDPELEEVSTIGSGSKKSGTKALSIKSVRTAKSDGDKASVKTGKTGKTAKSDGDSASVKSMTSSITRKNNGTKFTALINTISTVKDVNPGQDEIKKEDAVPMITKLNNIFASIKTGNFSAENKGLYLAIEAFINQLVDDVKNDKTITKSDLTQLSNELEFLQKAVVKKKSPPVTPKSKVKSPPITPPVIAKKEPISKTDLDKNYEEVVMKIRNLESEADKQMAFKNFDSAKSIEILNLMISKLNLIDINNGEYDALKDDYENLLKEIISLNRGIVTGKEVLTKNKLVELKNKFIDLMSDIIGEDDDEELEIYSETTATGSVKTVESAPMISTKLDPKPIDKEEDKKEVEDLLDKVGFSTKDKLKNMIENNGAAYIAQQLLNIRPSKKKTFADVQMTKELKWKMVLMCVLIKYGKHKTMTQEQFDEIFKEAQRKDKNYDASTLASSYKKAFGESIDWVKDFGYNKTKK